MAIGVSKGGYLNAIGMNTIFFAVSFLTMSFISRLVNGAAFNPR